MISGDITGLINRHAPILINGSSDKLNDHINTAWEATLEEPNTRLTLSSSNLKTDLENNGGLYIAKEVTIEHNLNSPGIIVSIFNVDTGEKVSINQRIIDMNCLSLLSETPYLGNFLVVVLG